MYLPPRYYEGFNRMYSSNISTSAYVLSKSSNTVWTWSWELTIRIMIARCCHHLHPFHFLRDQIPRDLPDVINQHRTTYITDNKHLVTIKRARFLSAGKKLALRRRRLGAKSTSDFQFVITQAGWANRGVVYLCCWFDWLIWFWFGAVDAAMGDLAGYPPPPVPRGLPDIMYSATTNILSLHANKWNIRHGRPHRIGAPNLNHGYLFIYELLDVISLRPSGSHSGRCICTNLPRYEGRSVGPCIPQPRWGVFDSQSIVEIIAAGNSAGSGQDAKQPDTDLYLQ